MVDRRMRLVLPALVVTAGLALSGGAALAHDATTAPVLPGSTASQAPPASIDPAALGPGLHVVGAWSRESPMMELAAAAFLVIVNDTDADDALVGASSPAAATVEIHQTTQAEDGTMAMAPVDEVPIPAGGVATLEPGGYHIMLMDLAAPLVEGQPFELTLEFASSEPQTVMVPVKALGPMATGSDDMGGSAASADAESSPEAGED
jgi:periplasmic copper chaperone A